MQSKHDQTAAFLQKSYPLAGLTLRSLAEAVGVGLKTMHRYVQGESCIPIKHIDNIASVVFDSLEHRRHFVDLCKEAHFECKGSAQKKRSLKKEYSKVKHKFYAVIGESISMRVKKAEDLSDKNNYEFSPIQLDAIVSVHLRENDRSQEIFRIHSEQGIIFGGDKDGDENDDVVGSEAVNQYVLFCRKHKIPSHGLIELAKRELQSPGALSHLENKTGEWIQLGSEDRQQIKNTWQEVLNVLDKKNPTNEEKDLLKFEIGLAMQLLDGSNFSIAQIDALKMKLQKQIDRISAIV